MIFGALAPARDFKRRFTLGWTLKAKNLVGVHADEIFHASVLILRKSTGDSENTQKIAMSPI
jgi:hypothetical protein